MVEPKIYEVIELYYDKRNNTSVPLEHFVLPFKKDRYIIYFPLKGIISLVNKEFVDNIKNNNPIVNALFNVVSKNPSIEMEMLNFENSKITLELTKNCNLRCIYCYANAGDKLEYLSWGNAKTAIDWMLKRCHGKTFMLGFHGGGEPLLAFPMMKKCCEYTKQKCKERGIKFKTAGVTNGTLITEEIAKWYKKIGMQPAISFDGMPNVQNLQRPFRDGTGSYEAVKKAVKILNKYKILYSINSTITSDSVSKLPDMVKYIKNLHPKLYWSISYNMDCGRCAETGIEKPNYEIFLRNAKIAEKIANKYGITVINTKKDENLIGTSKLFKNYCYACGEHFTITAGGHITSCGTITNEKDPLAKEFFYGKIKNGKVIINKKKLENLRNRTVNNMPQCKNCFAKYICRGTCLAEASRKSGNIYNVFKEECLKNKKQSYDFLKSKFE